MKSIKSGIAKADLANKAATRLANSIIKTQNVFAGYMYAVTKKWKQKQQWIFLYMVCLVFGGLSIVAIINSFKTKTEGKAIMPKPIAIPKNIQQQNNPFIITENEFQQVQEYKRKFPNLQKERPGLYDSLSLVEQIYYSQKNKVYGNKTFSQIPAAKKNDAGAAFTGSPIYHNGILGIGWRPGNSGQKSNGCQRRPKFAITQSQFKG